MANVKALANTVILDAAKESLDITKRQSIRSWSEGLGISTAQFSKARMIIRYGKPEDVKSAYTGDTIISVSNRVRAYMTVEQVAEFTSRDFLFSDERRKNLADESKLWATLSPMIKGVTELPSPTDMVRIVQYNNGRSAAVDENIETAFKWLEEFTNEWRKRKS